MDKDSLILGARGVVLQKLSNNMSNSDFNLLNSGAEEDASHAEMTEVTLYVFFFRHASVSSTYPCPSVSR